MSKISWTCAVAALAAVFTGVAIAEAEAGGRKQRSGSSQMRLGGPNGNGNGGNGGFVDRTGGPSLRNDRQIQRFFEQHRQDRLGPG